MVLMMPVVYPISYENWFRMPIDIM